MKKKRAGFTLVELLVVIAIIALLMGILMPALAKVRHIAYRMVCGSNEGGIGKAMLIYANDNDEEYPRAGGKNPVWVTTGKIAKFDAPSPDSAFSSGSTTISACLYLLVKYAEMPPKQFNCKGDFGVKELKLSDFTGLEKPANRKTEFQDLWDFGWNADPYLAGQVCSYAYHFPFSTTSTPSYAINATSDPESPVIADRNPILDKNANPITGPLGYWEGRDGKGQTPSWNADTGARDTDKTANSASHQRDGQNILFNDSHVAFELVPWCGIDKDNIWKRWTGDPSNIEDQIIQLGTPMQQYTPGAQPGPLSIRDAWLVGERN